MSCTRIASWIVAIVLALAFLFAGLFKLSGQEEGVKNFALWRYPDWFRIVVGVVEVVAAALLIVPRTRFVGAAIVVVTMLGAIGTHLHIAQYEALPPPVFLLVLGIASLLISRRRT